MKLGQGRGLSKFYTIVFCYLEKGIKVSLGSNLDSKKYLLIISFPSCFGALLADCFRSDRSDNGSTLYGLSELARKNWCMVSNMLSFVLLCMQNLPP